LCWLSALICPCHFDTVKSRERGLDYVESPLFAIGSGWVWVWGGPLSLEGVRPREMLAREGIPSCLLHVLEHSEAYGGAGFCLGPPCPRLGWEGAEPSGGGGEGG